MAALEAKKQKALQQLQQNKSPPLKPLSALEEMKRKAMEQKMLLLQ